MLAFRISYEDPQFVAIDKPSGFHSHPPANPKIRILNKWNALKILENQMGQKLYPCHRLDRATSGILLFAKSGAWAGELQIAASTHPWKKQYFALVRGAFPGEKLIEEDLKGPSGSLKSSATKVRALYQFEREEMLFRNLPRKFSLLEVSPLTGRFHQIRRHLAMHSFPIVGDSLHGDKKLNKEFFGKDKSFLYLRAAHLRFYHPHLCSWVSVDARWPKRWHYLFEEIGYCPVRGNLDTDFF